MPCCPARQHHHLRPLEGRRRRRRRRRHAGLRHHITRHYCRPVCTRSQPQRHGLDIVAAAGTARVPCARVWLAPPARGCWRCRCLWCWWCSLVLVLLVLSDARWSNWQLDWNQVPIRCRKRESRRVSPGRGPRAQIKSYRAPYRAIIESPSSHYCSKNQLNKLNPARAPLPLVPAPAPAAPSSYNMQAVAHTAASRQFRWAERPGAARSPPLCAAPLRPGPARQGQHTARAHSNASPDGSNDPFIDATLRLHRLISGVG
jgi:hypothetical protein